MVSQEQLAKETQQAYLGTAKIRIAYIACEGGSTQGQNDLDEKNVARLLRIFDIEGCRPEEWPVDAVIWPDALEAALNHSNLSPNDLTGGGKLLEFPDGAGVTCIHGKHRLAAGRYYLPPNESWWTVKLYRNDSSNTLLQYIREQDPNSSPFKDGEIFRYMRLHQINNNLESANLWKSRLDKGKSGSKLNDIAQLLRAASKDDKMKAFLDSLDALLPFRGLWLDFQVGCFHRLLTLRCPEEMSRYLRLVHRCWRRICGIGDTRADLDPLTVSLVEGKVPRHSWSDEKALRELWLEGSLFNEVKDPVERDRIWQTISSLRCRIPSLRTFLEDTKYLEACSTAVRGLLPTKFKGSLEDTLTRYHTRQLPIYDFKNSTCRVNEITTDETFRIAYLQVWLFCFRNFADLTDIQPRKDSGKSKPLTKGRSPLTWNSFAVLAQKSGFETAQIRKLVTQDPREQMCEEFLRRTNPMGYQSFHTDQLSRDIERLMTHINELVPRSDEKTVPCPPLSSNLSTVLSPDQRSGKPFEAAYYNNREFLFVDTIFEALDDIEEDRALNVTQFAIQKEILRAFFGTLECLDTTTSNLPNTAPTQPTSTDTDGDLTMHETHRLDTSQANLAPKEQTTAETGAASIPVEQRSADSDGNITMLEATNLNAGEADPATEENATVGTERICMPAEQTNTTGDGNTNMLLITGAAAADLDEDGNVIMSNSADVGFADSDSRGPERTKLLTYSEGNAESTALAIVPSTNYRKEPENSAPDVAVDPTSVAIFSIGSQEAADSGPSKITTSGDENLTGVYWKKAPQPMNGISPSILVDEIWKWSIHWKIYNPGKNLPFVCMCDSKKCPPSFLFFYDLWEACQSLDPEYRWWYCQPGEFGEGVAGVFKCFARQELFTAQWPPGTVFALTTSSQTSGFPDPVCKGSENHTLPGELFFTFNQKEGIEEEL